MTWYEFVVFVHVVAAIIWVGGILFLGIIAVPAVRRLEAKIRADLMSTLGRRFRAVGYTLLGILIVTGIIQAALRGATVANVLDGSFFRTPFGATLGMKLLFVFAMLAVSVVHDFVIGPASVRATQEGKDAERLRRTASYLARVVAVLALIVVAYAVMLVR